MVEVDFDKHFLSTKLPEYEPGTPEKPASGFESIELKQAITSQEAPKKIPIDLFEDLLATRHKREQFNSEEVISTEGESYIAYTRELKETDIFWLYPDKLFIRGAKTEVKGSLEHIRNAFPNRSIRAEEFDEDFLFWLLSQDFQNSVIGNELSIVKLTEVELSGSADQLGEHSEIKASSDITSSIPALLGTLGGKKIESLTGYFEIYGSYLSASISTDGRVHIKTKGDIAEASAVTRMSLSIALIDSLVSLYEAWEEMDIKDKYPSPELFVEMYEACSMQGIEVSFSIEDVIEEQLEKRGESMKDISFDLSRMQ